MLGRFVSGVCVCAASARRGARRTNSYRLPVRPAHQRLRQCAHSSAWRRVMYCRETVSIVRPPPSTRLVRVDGSIPGRDSEVVESIVYDTSYDDPEHVVLRPWYTRRPCVD